ncbi:MAG: family transcriptional regulator, partial [Planctomycetaceae bacterium]|nr:family transcriptional regulator [Planctomycetaceae bacterium]
MRPGMNSASMTKRVLADRLREARKRSGLTQGQVSKMLKLHRPTITEIEAGNRRVSAEELTQFAKIYGVSIEWLSDLEAENLELHKDQVEFVIQAVKKFTPDDMHKLINVMTAKLGSRSVELSRPTVNVRWTEELNARRCELIDQKLQQGLSNDEAVELESLQQSMRRHVNQVA